MKSVIVDGIPRLLACIPGSSRRGLKRFSSVVPVMPKSEWRTINRRKSFNVNSLIDQKNHGSCTGFATAGALYRVYRMTGQKPPLLSGSFMYSKVNGGQDQGAMIGDLIKAGKEGTCSQDMCPWNAIYPRQIRPEAYQEAKRWRIKNAYVVETFAEIMTAIQLGQYIPVFAVMVGNNFMNIDSNGVAGFDRGPGNHAVTGDGARIGTNPVIDMPNSWGPTFGDQGRAFLTERHLDSVMQDAFVIEAAEEDDADPVDPPGR